MKKAAYFPRVETVTAIATLRKEWDLEANRESLICIRASVGLLLADVVIGCGFTPGEQQEALGAELFRELEVAGVLTLGNSPQQLPADTPEWVPEAWVLSEQTQEH